MKRLQLLFALLISLALLLSSGCGWGKKKDPTARTKEEQKPDAAQREAKQNPDKFVTSPQQGATDDHDDNPVQALHGDSFPARRTTADDLPIRTMF